MFAAEALKSGWFLENAWLIPLVPGIGFALIILFGKRLPMKGAELGIGTLATSLVLAVGAAVQWIQRVNAVNDSHGAAETVHGFARSVFPQQAEEGHHVAPFVEPVIRQWTWWQSGGLELNIGQHIDGLAVMLLFLVAFISLLVQIFSLDYVRGDRRYTHFFAAMTLFSAGMLVMVLAENMVQLILGWEIMGLCSFMLIGHWWEDEANSRAALKAFFTVRVGDVGLLVGTAVIFFGANQWAVDNLDSNGFSISAIQAWALSGEGSATVLTWGAVALFIACIGKSGQFPLHTWLPDAMAGPTPVSSLLHSSTMVVAGVFLVARLYPVFWEGLRIGETNINFIALIGAVTLVVSAFLAFVQHDIKKVLAYSTVSQLGYMMLGLGAGAWLPAVFHIFTHAFFKCCLFLCAGSVSHSGSHHSFDMKKDMGGLAKKMPITAGAWIVSTLALAGVFPLSGFFSKDEIIDNVGHNGYTAFMWMALGGAFLTAAYMTRATYLTFFGEARGAAAGEHHDPHDPAYAHGEEHALDEIESDIAEHEHDSELVHAGGGAAHGASHGLTNVDPEPDAASGGALVGSAAHASHDGHGSGGGHESHDDHHGPRESGPLILVPVVILAFLAAVSGFTNAVPFGDSWARFQKYVEQGGVAVEAIPHDSAPTGPGEAVRVVFPDAQADEEHAEGCGLTDPAEGTYCYYPAVSHAEFKWSKAALSLVIVAIGLLSTWAFCVAYYTRRNRFLVGLTERNRAARAGYLFLWNKYYLDDLYEKVIVRGIAHPIAQAAYWINQNVIDGIVNATGKGGKRTGEWVYRNIDQRVVDGAVNASGSAASGTGHALQPVQSGKVSQYGALLFGAAAVGAIALVIANV